MGETKYSFIYPIRNRASLLKRGLQSLNALDYDKDSFEVVIVDYMSDDHIQEVINEFRGFLNMKYLCIDIRRYKYYQLDKKTNKCNPALAQNIGVNAASGEFVIFTSPEIVHFKKNLKNLDSIPDLTEKFLYGRVIEKTESDLFTLHYPFDVIDKLDSPIVLCDWDSKDKSVTVYFIGVMARSKFLKYGGIDEEYMRAIAYEDEDFGMRMANAEDIKLVYDKNVCGVHLTHDRSYQTQEAIGINARLVESKKEDGWKKHLVANKGIKAGDFDVLIQKSQYWRF